MSASTPVPSASAPDRRIALRKLLWVGPLAIIAAVAANAVVRAIALAVLKPDPSFTPLHGPTFIGLTVAGVLGAVITFAIVARYARRPIRTYHVIALVALLISFVPDVALLATGNAAPAGPAAGGPPMMGGVTLPNVIALMLMHVVAYAISVGLLTTLTREAAARAG